MNKYERELKTKKILMENLKQGMKFTSVCKINNYLNSVANLKIDEVSLHYYIFNCLHVKKMWNGEIEILKVNENPLPPILLRKESGGELYWKIYSERTKNKKLDGKRKTADIIERNKVLSIFFNPNMAYHKGIYLIYNDKTMESYVGSCSNSFLERARVHYADSNKDNQYYTYDLMHKEGTLFYPIHFCDDMTQDEILQLEEKYISKLFNTSKYGYKVINRNKETGFYANNELSCNDIEGINNQIELGNRIMYIKNSKVGFTNDIIMPY